MQPLLALFLVLIPIGAWSLARVRREFRSTRKLSTPTVVAVWVLYPLHFALVTVASWNGYWPIPLPGPVAEAIGFLLASLGTALYLAALVSFRSFRLMSGVTADRLVTSGVYRWSRNPQSVGWLLFLIGIAVAGKSGLALFMIAAFWLMFLVHLPVEEEFLERSFGDQYGAYRSTTHRFLGFPKSSR